MKLFGISCSLFLVLTHGTFFWGQADKIYLFIYESDLTTSGAGHVAFAFGEDTSQLIYYTKYRQKDGGGKKVNPCTFQQAQWYDSHVLKNQSSPPSLILELPIDGFSKETLEKLSDHWHLQEPWTLFVNNCTDAVKRVLRKTKINPGFAFLISTPNELIEDLVENNTNQFKNQTFRCVKGDLCFYLKNERNGVSQVIWGKRKKRMQKVNKPCF